MANGSRDHVLVPPGYINRFLISALKSLSANHQVFFADTYILHKYTLTLTTLASVNTASLLTCFLTQIPLPNLPCSNRVASLQTPSKTPTFPGSTSYVYGADPIALPIQIRHFNWYVYIAVTSMIAKRPKSSEITVYFGSIISVSYTHLTLPTILRV